MPMPRTLSDDDDGPAPPPARARAKLAAAGPEAHRHAYPDDVADAPVEQSWPVRTSAPGFIIALSGLALTSGTIHIVATIEHADVNLLLSAFFALVGVAQVFAAWWIFRNPDDERMLKLAALGSVIVSLLWVFSRTTGIPFGPEPGRAAIGVADTITTLQQFVFAALVVVLLRRREAGDRRLPWLSGHIGARLTPALLTASMLMASIGGHEH